MVYVAAPFFNDLEIKYLDQLRAFYDAQDIKAYFPQDYKVPDGENMPNHEWAEHVYNMDVEALRKCEAVVAVYFGQYSDTGVAWEIGYACALGKPVIVLVVDTKVDQSIMPINSAYFVFKFDDYIKDKICNQLFNEINQK